MRGSAEKAAEQELIEYKRGNAEGRHQWMRLPWLVRVCMAKPLSSARAFAQAHADLVGGANVRDGAGCSRPTITSIQCAFVDLCEERNIHEIVAIVTSQFDQI